MLRTTFSILTFALILNNLQAQESHSPTPRPTLQSLSPVDANLQKETSEVESFARNLAALKAAYANKDASKTIAYEAYVLRGMRDETDQMIERAAAESAQAEHRKNASSGQITGAIPVENAPARDPFAEATTPTEIRLEKMQYTLAAFERHSFDPGQPEAAARDFAKLDAFLAILQEELAELKKIKG